MKTLPGARAVLLVTVALLATACGSSRRSAGPEPTSARPVLKIATASPLSGDRAVLGSAIRNGVLLAAERRAKEIAALGFDVKVVPYDDRARRGVGIAKAEEIVADPDVLFVIGHLTSNVAVPASEVYQRAGLAMISPANSDPQLTDRGFLTVSRVVGRDDIQGAAAADFAATELKARRVFIVHDGSPAGLAVAAAFRERARRTGLSLAGERGLEKDLGPLLAALAASPPDLVYLSMTFAQAGAVIRQARAKEVKSAFIGPDWLDSPRLLQVAGRSAVGTYFTLVAGPPDFYAGSEAFVQDYRKRFTAEPPPFALQAFDAATLGLEALSRAIRAAGGKPSRGRVAAEIRRTAGFRGLTGTLTLDARGDPDPAVYFVVQVTSANPAEWDRRKLVDTLHLSPPAGSPK